MKKVKGWFLFALFIVCMLIITGCKDDTYERLKTVQVEVDYNPIYVTNRGISINNDEDFYVSKAKEIINFDTMKHGDYRNVHYFNGNVFFVMEYDSYYSHNKKSVEALNLTYDEEHQRCYAKLALFKVNALTGKCELLEDLGEVYHTDLFDHYALLNVLKILSDSMAALTYNGKLQLYDLDSCTVVQSFDIYDPKEYCCFDSTGPENDIFPFNMYGNDYAAVFEDRIDYYKFDGNEFEKHTLEVNAPVGETFGVAKNTFYSYTYMGGWPDKWEPGFCFNTETLEILVLPIEDIFALRTSPDDSSNSESEDKGYIVEHNGKGYNVTSVGGNSFEILDSDGQLIQVVDKEMLESNDKYAELVAIDEDCSCAAPEKYFVKNDKLYFYCRGSYGWAASTPNFIFEYDFDTGSLKYAGMVSQASYVWKIIIQ